MQLHGRHRIVRWLGRRGVFLLMFGAIYTAYGIAIIELPAPRFFVPVLDSPRWGLMWIAAGVAAAVTAFRPARRADGAAGFVALLAAPVVWSLFFTASVVLALVTEPYGTTRSVTGVVVWAAEWSVVLLVAGWPDPDRPERDGPRRARRG